MNKFFYFFKTEFYIKLLLILFFKLQFMKTNKIILFFLFFLSSTSFFGQIKNLGKPKSWMLKSDETEVTTIKMPSFNVETYRSLDSINDAQKNGPWRFGHKFNVSYDLNNSGVWTSLPNGDRIWRFKVKSKDALSLNFIFENLFIPEGATIYIHKSDKSSYLGAYTSINNNNDRILGTDLIMGESAIIEYFEPSSVFGQGSLLISTIVHGYRDISLHDNSMIKALNDSGDCNRDIKCLTDPEPLWVNEANSVALIIVNGNGACTGTLVNNSAQDGKPYFLTANHCLGNPATWAFRFKWISPVPDCATTANSPAMIGETQFQTLNGSVLRATNAASDFALVEITNLNLSLAQDWGLYYSGWDKTGSAVAGAIGIHHPSGDIMKYARENNALTQMADGMWEVANWDEGVTEPGSSGSGLWDLNHHLIGQLYGGGAACNGTTDNNQSDFYGRFDLSWNGTSAANRLRDWLDPTNSGVGVLDGYDPNMITANLDAGIQSVSSPNDNYCGVGEVSPAFTLVNKGVNTLMSAQIEYSFDGGISEVFSWNGSLMTNQTELITLPTSTLGDGNHTFTVTILNVNAQTDENDLNNSLSKNFNINLNGNAVDFALTLDCYGSEVTWELTDENMNVVALGGPYADGIGGEIVTEQWCLAASCFVFTINDSYEDGLNGALWPECGLDGSYSISQNGDVLASILAVNSNFGAQEVNEFCVIPNIAANFTATQAEVCINSDVSFNNTSIGTILTYNWTFPGGIPNSSNEENPVVNYPIAGTYDVTLTVSDGISISTQTFENYVLVSEVPQTPSISTASGLNIVCLGSSLELSSSSLGGNLWSTGETTQSIVVEQEGFYSLSVVENSCSSISSTVFISELTTTPILVESFQNTSACGVSDGSITVNGTDVVGNISWSGTSSGSVENILLPFTLNNLSAGSYTFNFDNNCFMSSTNQVINETGAPIAPIVSANGNTTFCVGESVELTSNTSGITWNTGSTNESIVVSNPGTYFATFNDGICTLVSNNISISFFGIPSAPIIQINGSTEICEGDVLELVSSELQGNMWSTTESTQAILVNQSGTYELSFTDGNGCISESASVNIIVNPLPNTPIISANGSTTFCQGESVVLNSSELNGNLWSTSETSSSINVNQSGFYSVIFTDVNSCQAFSNEIEIIVNPLPIVEAGSNVQVCMGESVTLNGSGASTYTWNGGVSDGVSFVPIQTLTYTVTGTDNNSCSNTDQVLVTVNNFLTISFSDFDDVCLQSPNFNLNTAIPSNGTYSGTGVVNNTFSPSSAGVGTHAISYSVVTGAGCESIETAQIVVNDCASLNEFALNNVSIFPNPIENEMSIKLEGNFDYEIIDARGRLITFGAGENLEIINTSNFQAGIYLVKIISNKNNSTFRIVKN
jgi:lysyl endopeptidase